MRTNFLEEAKKPQVTLAQLPPGTLFTCSIYPNRFFMKTNKRNETTGELLAIIVDSSAPTTNDTSFRVGSVLSIGPDNSVTPYEAVEELQVRRVP